MRVSYILFVYSSPPFAASSLTFPVQVLSISLISPALNPRRPPSQSWTPLLLFLQVIIITLAPFSPPEPHSPIRLVCISAPLSRRASALFACPLCCCVWIIHKYSDYWSCRTLHLSSDNFICKFLPPHLNLPTFEASTVDRKTKIKSIAIVRIYLNSQHLEKMKFMRGVYSSLADASFFKKFFLMCLDCFLFCFTL